MEAAFRIIEDRKTPNTVTSIFLLSDGQDSNAGIRVQELLFQG